MAEVQDQWTAGTNYEEFMGRWSRRIAPDFVACINAPRGVHWLDVGCGTGALTEAICLHAAPASVLGCDPAASFVEFARARNRDPRQSYAVAGIGALPRRPGGFGSVSSLFALNFMPDAPAAMREMCAVTAAGGAVSVCVWDYRAGMQFLRRFWDAAVSLDPAASALDEGTRFPICAPEPLTAAFRGAGLTDISLSPLETVTLFSDFDDFWRPFLGGTGPAPSYVASLPADRRGILAARVREALPYGANGTIALSARAWAVRARVVA